MTSLREKDKRQMHKDPDASSILIPCKKKNPAHSHRTSFNKHVCVRLRTQACITHNVADLGLQCVQLYKRLQAEKKFKKKVQIRVRRDSSFTVTLVSCSEHQSVFFCWVCRSSRRLTVTAVHCQKF